MELKFILPLSLNKQIDAFKKSAGFCTGPAFLQWLLEKKAYPVLFYRAFFVEKPLILWD